VRWWWWWWWWWWQILKRTVKEFYGADPQQSEWFGRCINAKAQERLAALVADSKSKLVFGGACDVSDL
jgi:aldehyde dehydrogenase (NAD+)